MTPSPTVASASARSTTYTPTTSEAQAFALLQALSDATMARLYLHKGNLPAARRKPDASQWGTLAQVVVVSVLMAAPPWRGANRHASASRSARSGR